jgi:hypothetical protein
MTKPTRQELDRIIIGNQIACMRALSLITKSLVGDINHSSELDLRIANLKSFWKTAYDEEVGFASTFDRK